MDERQRLAQLCDPDDPTLDVAATLTLSVSQLSPDAQAAFRQLGVLASDFTTALAQALVALPGTPDIETLLRQLLRRNLVMYDTAARRWRLHDLVRDLARQLLEPADATTARQRYAQAVVQLAHELRDQYLGGKDAAVAALARFDAERPHIEAAWHWGDQRSATAEGDHLLLELALATAQLGELRLEPEREHIPRLQCALSAAQRLGRLHDQGWVLLSLGRASFSAGEMQRAPAAWQQARSLFQSLGDRHSEGCILSNLGNAHARLGNPQRAIPLYSQALEIFRQMDDRRREGHALGNLGGGTAPEQRLLSGGLGAARPPRKHDAPDVLAGCTGVFKQKVTFSYRA